MLVVDCDLFTRRQKATRQGRPARYREEESNKSFDTHSLGLALAGRNKERRQQLCDNKAVGRRAPKTAYVYFDVHKFRVHRYDLAIVSHAADARNPADPATVDDISSGLKKEKEEVAI